MSSRIIGSEAVAGDLPMQATLRLFHVCNAIYSRSFHQLHQHNPCPIPRTGPALIAANHTAGLDPSIIQAACPRRIMFVMTRRFYDLPSMNWLFRWTGMIPVDVTGRDARAWRFAIDQLRLGRVVGVFPEGRIERRRELMAFGTGIALLAIRGGANLYPVYLDGLQRDTPMLHTYLLPQNPSVAWGRAVGVAHRNPNRQTLRMLTDELQKGIQMLQREYPSPRRRGVSMLQPPQTTRVQGWGPPVPQATS